MPDRARGRDGMLAAEGITRRQVVGGLLAVAALVVAIAVIVTMSGRGGSSVHPQPGSAVAPTATAAVSSRAP